MKLTAEEFNKYPALVLALALPVGLVLLMSIGQEVGIDLQHRLVSPNLLHPMGTDHLGRDLLVRLFMSFYQTVLPLWICVVVSSVFGTSLALFVLVLQSDYFRKVGTRIEWIVDFFDLIFGSVPVGVIVFLWSLYHEEAGIVTLMESLSFIVLIRTYSYVKNLYHCDHHQGFWIAHQSVGGSLLKRIWKYGICTYWKHRLTNLCLFHLQMVVIIESSLSYLGFGIQEPSASFGNILSSHLGVYLKGHYFVIMFTTGFIVYASIFPYLVRYLLLQNSRSRNNLY